MPGNRRAGRNGAIYASIAAAGTPEPLYYVKSWTFEAKTDQIEVTAFGDANKSYVTGLPDGKITYQGFWDDSSNDVYSAALDGLPRKFYLYEDRNNKPNTYIFGSGFFDFSMSADVGGAVQISGNVSANGSWTRNVG